MAAILGVMMFSSCSDSDEHTDKDDAVYAQTVLSETVINGILNKD